MVNYPVEELDPDEDDGTMPANVEELASHIVGHKIVSVVDNVITLDNGKTVTLINDADCCAYTEVESFLLHPEMVDHVITGVGTTEGYSKWHIYADMGDILELSVGWSAGNPFYYGYGFNIYVQ